MWAAILNAITQDIHIMDVAILMALVWIVRSLKSLKESQSQGMESLKESQLRESKHLKEILKEKLEPIEKALSNHITETKAEIRLLRERLDRLYELILKRKDKASNKEKNKK